MFRTKHTAFWLYQITSRFWFTLRICDGKGNLS